MVVKGLLPPSTMIDAYNDFCRAYGYMIGKGLTRVQKRLCLSILDQYVYIYGHHWFSRYDVPRFRILPKESYVRAAIRVDGTTGCDGSSPCYSGYEIFHEHEVTVFTDTLFVFGSTAIKETFYGDPQSTDMIIEIISSSAQGTDDDTWEEVVIYV
jgi:hypothetical protein